ncbi:MAG: helix-turn-helix transcriptional regulator [Lachnospiraceae bacterium]|jgi:transcriptional regulator with XRE-family HTH domain|nr:helix-turn-helix transcriptional regulator [Lachnospiraceae bacterium]MCI8871600.1 helix-turn-helix transcriptional regulator [Lachnospiraceae bacterium]MCI9060389.1 helix-turn-helix transcriptional regulator [Lachnospiraceae bacterium]
MRIADKIKNARIQKEYTQEQAAENLFVSRQTISNWENGKSLPDILSIIRMSELYELSIDELIKGDDVLLKKIEKDTKAVKAEKKIIKFAWISIVTGTILIILGEIFEGNPLIDFINGALPWVLLSLILLSAILYLNKEEKA